MMHRFQVTVNTSLVFDGDDADDAWVAFDSRVAKSKDKNDPSYQKPVALWDGGNIVSYWMG